MLAVVKVCAHGVGAGTVKLEFAKALETTDTVEVAKSSYSQVVLLVIVWQLLPRRHEAAAVVETIDCFNN